MQPSCQLCVKDGSGVRRRGHVDGREADAPRLAGLVVDTASRESDLRHLEVVETRGEGDVGFLGDSGRIVDCDKGLAARVSTMRGS